MSDIEARVIEGLKRRWTRPMSCAPRRQNMQKSAPGWLGRQRAVRADKASRAEMAAIRALVMEIVMTPLDVPGRVDLEIRSDLVALTLESDEAARR